MNDFLKLIGWRRHPDHPTIPLFRTWHSYVVLAVALLVGASLGKVL